MAKKATTATRKTPKKAAAPKAKKATKRKLEVVPDEGDNSNHGSANSLAGSAVNEVFSRTLSPIIPNAAGSGRSFIGISGWTYADWRGDFYPKGVTQKRELEYCSRQLNSVEINGTFYAIQKPPSFQSWYAATPENFVFAVKANKYITHIRRAKDVETPMANFLASGILCLGEKLGPILWQFPPSLTLKDDRFEKFCALLPRDFNEARQLAKKQTFNIEGGIPEGGPNYPIRHAFEFRHPSFFMTSEFTDMLRKNNVAVVFGHSGMNNPYVEDVTSDFIYARMHGQEKPFAKGYTDTFLADYAKRVELWTAGTQPADAVCMSPHLPNKQPRDAFIYFDTEYKSAAPNDAMTFMQKLGLKKAA